MISIAGHTPGSIALLYDDSSSDGGHPHLFTGDSLFPGGVGNTFGDKAAFEQLIDDVEQKIFGRLPDDTWFYPGHGNDSTLGAERPSPGRVARARAGSTSRRYVHSLGTHAWTTVAVPDAPGRRRPDRWRRAEGDLGVGGRAGRCRAAGLAAVRRPVAEPGRGRLPDRRVALVRRVVAVRRLLGGPAAGAGRDLRGGGLARRRDRAAAARRARRRSSPSSWPECSGGWRLPAAGTRRSRPPPQRPLFTATPLFGGSVVNGELFGLPFVLAGMVALVRAHTTTDRRAVLAWGVAAGASRGAGGAREAEHCRRVRDGVGPARRPGRARCGRSPGCWRGPPSRSRCVLVASLQVGTSPADLWDAVVTFRFEAAEVLAGAGQPGDGGAVRRPAGVARARASRRSSSRRWRGRPGDRRPSRRGQARRPTSGGRRTPSSAGSSSWCCSAAATGCTT